MSDDREPSAVTKPEPTPWAAIALTLVIALVLAALVFAIDPLRESAGFAIRGDTGGLREKLDSLGAGSVAVLATLMVVHTFVWFPAEIIDAAAGFAYGFWLALPLVLLGWVLQGLLAYAIGRNTARPLLTRFIGEKRFTSVEQMVADGGVQLLIAARMVPIVPFSLFCLVAGAAEVPIRRYTWTTAVGYLPITAIFVYFGSRLESLSPTDPILWAGAAAMIAMLWFSRHLKPGRPPSPGER